MTIDRDQIPRVVGASALAIGAGHALAPVPSGRFWGLAPDSAPVVPHVIRAYGLSLMGLAVLTLRAGSDEEVLKVATGVGALTALTGLLGGMRGRVGWRSAVMTVVAAGGLAALAATGVRKW
ncbi:MAG: hypothetical protein ABWY29_07155 [Blastococcus sp.]